MQLDWQSAVSVVLVGWSLLFLLKRLNPLVQKPEKSCGSCAGCSKNTTELHQLGS